MPFQPRVRLLFPSALAALAASVACSSGPDIRGPLPIGAGVGAEVVTTTSLPDRVPPPDVPVALVMDSGFDVEVAEFKDRIAGAYSIVCDKPPPDDGVVPSYEEAKVSTIAYYGRRDESCHLERKITLKRSAWLSALGSYRDEWNDLVRRGSIGEGTFPEYKRFYEILFGEDRYDYHGTSVLGLAAAVASPNAQFVVVDRAYDIVEAKNRLCPTSESLELSTRLYKDPDVLKAYLARPVARLDEELVALRARFHVRYENRSYYYRARSDRESECPNRPWRAYFAAANELSALAEAERGPKYFGGQDVLSFQCAGNDAALMAGPEDTFHCTSFAPSHGPDSADVIVGAYDADRMPSSFSNRGPCVDVYAPGKWVNTTAPGGFLVTFSGTSAAAPLSMGLAMARFGNGALSAKDRKTRFLNLRDAESKLPIYLFPSGVFYPSFWFRRDDVGTRSLEILLKPRRPEAFPGAHFSLGS